MITQTIGELLTDRVTLELEGIDRLYLNAYQPGHQTGGGVAHFFKQHRGKPVVSTTLMAPMTKAFVESIKRFIAAEQIEMVRFEKSQRKDNITQAYVKRHDGREGVLYC